MQTHRKIFRVTLAILLLLVGVSFVLFLPLIKRRVLRSYASGTCPTGFTCSDVGPPNILGSQTLTSGTWSITAAGSDIYNTTDQGNFISQSLQGDGTVTARVVSQANTSGSAKAGVVIRQNSASGSAYMGIFVTPSNGLQLQYRTATGSSTVSSQATTSAFLTLPIYLRVQRIGSYFLPSSSTDGVTWNDLSYTRKLSIFGTTQAGMMVTSHNSGTSGTSTFDHMSVDLLDICPFGWTCTDVGSPTISGKTYYQGGYYLEGSGTGLGVTDQFHYLYQSFAIDGTLQGRIASHQYGDASNSQTGFMFRQSTDSNAAFFSASYQPSLGIVVQARTAAGASITQVASVSASLAEYVKIVKLGQNFDAYTSPDGTTWTKQGSTVTLIENNPMIGGMYTTSADGTISSTGMIDNLTTIGGSVGLGPFLKRDNQKLTYNGQEVKLFGATIYPSQGGSAPSYNWLSPWFYQRIDYDLNQAQTAKLNVIRPTDQTNGASDDVYDAISWYNMDYLVNAALAKNMFVEMDLSTFANNLKSQSINPYDSSLWTTFINFVTARYKNAKNISFYSVDGEVNPTNSQNFPTSTAQGYIDFFTGTTNQIYSQDTNHLIAPGGLSFLNQDSYGIPWQSIFGAPHVDIAAIHVYPSDATDPINKNEDLSITLPKVGTWASSNHKPAVVEEYGFQQQLTDASRSAAIQTVQTAISNNGFSGQLIWNLGPEVLGGSHYDVNSSWPLAWAQLIAGAPATAFSFATAGLPGPQTWLTTIAKYTAPASGAGPGNPNQHPNWSYPVMAGPGFVGKNDFISGDATAPSAQTYFPPGSVHDDVWVSIKKANIFDLMNQVKPIPMPWVQNFQMVGEIYYFSALSAFNGFPIATFDRPVIITVPFDRAKVLKRGFRGLRIAAYNPAKKRWDILTAPVVINYQNSTLSTTVKNFTYFTVVYGK